MNYLNDIKNSVKLQDGVFATLKKYKEDQNDEKINSTIGSLFNEEGQLVAYDSIYKSFRSLENTDHASYPKALSGNEDFLAAIYEFFNEGIVKLNHSEVATTGGTGALNLAFANYSNKDETVLIPDIAWGNYDLMADSYYLNIVKYQLTNLDDLFIKIEDVVKKQNKVVIIINDPAQNPTGYSMGKNNWEKLINFLNKFEDTPIMIINDVAYIDYCYEKNYKEYLDTFNKAKEHIVFHVAYSLSKSFTFYGQRVGAAIIFNKNQKVCDDLRNAFTKTIRVTTSCTNNAVMKTFTDVYKNHYKEYQNDLNKAKNTLKMRSELFIKEAKENNLKLYPYSGGFFITIKIEDPKLNKKIHSKLIENHIYLVKVSKGLRLAVCSLNMNNIKGLAKKIKDIINLYQK